MTTSFEFSTLHSISSGTKSTRDATTAGNRGLSFEGCEKVTMVTEEQKLKEKACCYNGHTYPLQERGGAAAYHVHDIEDDEAADTGEHFVCKRSVYMDVGSTLPPGGWQ